MHMSRLFALALSLVLVISGAARADQTTLDSLIDLALKNYPDLQAASLSEAGLSYDARAAGALPDPQFTLSLLNLPTSSLALDETPMSGVAVGVSQRLPWARQVAGAFSSGRPAPSSESRGHPSRSRAAGSRCLRGPTSITRTGHSRTLCFGNTRTC